MSFNNLYRRVLRGTSASHTWIDLHRLVEAYCRTMAAPFTEVFAMLEAEFGFVRSDPRRWPTLQTMRAAADSLHARRAGALDERRAWIDAHRRARALSREAPAPAALKEVDARSRARAASVPRVGYRGWRARRVGNGPRGA